MDSSSVEMNVGNVSFHLKRDHDFSWLQSLGEVFAVFDKQDSGNICFGVKKNGVCRFVKYAGADTLNFSGHTKDAVTTLKQAVHLYEELNPPHLIQFIDHVDVGKGYAAIFEWFDGESLWKHNRNGSVFKRFRQLPVERRLESLRRMYEFHVHVESMNHVAIDFYDGSILYDFEKNITKICDIDLYKKKPFINTMGRLWGSSRFMSPEEFTLGSEIDERTNVFNMGAAAFVFLGGGIDRSVVKWEADRDLYNVAKKAIEPDRDHRFVSVKEFFTAWNSAL